jgi:hypothetical protein
VHGLQLAASKKFTTVGIARRNGSFEGYRSRPRKRPIYTSTMTASSRGGRAVSALLKGRHCIA